MQFIVKNLHYLKLLYYILYYKTGIHMMQWGNRSFECSDISMEDIEQEIQENGDVLLIQMKERLVAGDVEAFEFIGTAYLCGTNGLQADFDKVLIFLQLAAQGGSTAALLYLGDCCVYGIGMPVDLDTARKYYRLAAQSQTPSVREAACRQLEMLEQH